MSQSKQIKTINKKLATVAKNQKALAKKNPPLRQRYINDLSTSSHFFGTNNYEIFELFDATQRKDEPVSLIETKMNIKLQVYENAPQIFRVIAFYYRATVGTSGAGAGLPQTPSILDVVEELQPLAPLRYVNRRNINVFMDRTYCLGGSNPTNHDMVTGLPQVKTFRKTKRYKKDKLKLLKACSENQQVWHPYMIVLLDHHSSLHAPLLQIRNTTEYFSKI